MKSFDVLDLIRMNGGRECNSVRKTEVRRQRVSVRIFIFNSPLFSVGKAVLCTPRKQG